MKIIFFGTPAFVVPVLETLNENFEVVGVVTATDKKSGRKQLLTPSSIKTCAQNHQIPVFTPEKLAEAVDSLKRLEPDLFVVASYGKIIPQSVLDIPKFGSLNIHPSLLPIYRGPSPIQTTILNGDKISGVTILIVDNKMDHGPIVITKEFSLLNTDTFDSLSKKMFALGAELLVKIIPDFIVTKQELETPISKSERELISGKVEPIEQDHEKATFTKMFTKEDGYFDINNPPSPEILDRMIRAFYPWPTAWTRLRQDFGGQASGKIVKFLPGNLVQMEGKKPTKLKDFLQGYPTFPIKSFF